MRNKFMTKYPEESDSRMNARISAASRPWRIEGMRDETRPANAINPLQQIMNANGKTHKMYRSEYGAKTACMETCMMNIMSSSDTMRFPFDFQRPATPNAAQSSLPIEEFPEHKIYPFLSEKRRGGVKPHRLSEILYVCNRVGPFQNAR